MTSLLDEYLAHVHKLTAFRSGRMEVGRVRSTLLREQGFNGEVMPRHVYAERRVAAGNVELDYKRKHYRNTESGTLFLFSDVTLAVVDYTEWLLDRKDHDTTKKAEHDAPPSPLNSTSKGIAS